MEFYLELIFTALISVLLAFLLGKLFTDGDDADRDREPTKIADAGHGNDSLRSDQVDASLPSDPDKKCEKDKGAYEVKSDEISIKESSSEVKIERPSGDLREEEEVDREAEMSELRGVRVDDDSSSVANVASSLVKEGDGLPQVRSAEVDDLEIRFEARTAEDNTPSVMSERVESEFLEEIVARIDECAKDVTGLREEGTALKEGCQESKNLTHEKDQSLLLSEDDDWEGIERTDLHKRFHEAAAYVGSEGGEFALSNLSDDDQMQLYGLHKVATEGPCYDPQPMALKVSARAKWNAWHILGNINPDAAMEQYMSLLSDKVPEWTGEKHKGDDEKHEQSKVAEVASSGAYTPNFFSNVHSHLSTETERRQESPACITEENESAVTKHSDQGVKD